MNITLDTCFSDEGIVCSHAVMGKVATITRDFPTGATDIEWTVRPYTFPIWERGANFLSLQGAEHYALALAYDMLATGAYTHS